MTRRSRWVLRGVPLMFGLLLVLAYMLLRVSEPVSSWKGTVLGLEQPVKIHLDQLGVPHIFAASDDDAALALGFLHSRDRRFQLELVRMTSQGRLTELFGKELLEVDRRLRILTFQLDETVQNLAEADRRRLQAYCQGINQAWSEMPRPLELRVIQYRPAPWTIRDVIAVGRLQAWGLSVDAGHEAIRDRLAHLLSPELLRWMTRPSPTLTQPIVAPDEVRGQPPELLGDRSSSAAGSPRPSGALGGSARELADHVNRWAARWIDEPRMGSNAWALSGAHTADGHPLLAGDPHLPMNWPAFFYEAHVHTPEIDVHGATFPGLPMIVIGRAAGVAWSITNSFADTQDLFALAIDPADSGRYLVDGVAEPFRKWPQTFTWGDGKGEAVTEEYRISRFGPVYNPGREKYLLPGKIYALTWTGFDPSPLAIASSFDRLYRAVTPDEVVAAIEMLWFPSQSWVFITRTSHIGFVLGGRLPARRASPFPRDGSTATAAWTSWLAHAERPIVIDPPSGRIVSTNQPILADVEKFNTYAGGSYRALRIAARLNGTPKWDPDGSRRLQLDTVDLEASRLAPLMIAAGEHLLGACQGQAAKGISSGASTSSECGLAQAERNRAREMVDRLHAWRFDMRADLSAPLIYTAWRGHLYQRLFGHHLRDRALLEVYLRELAEAPMDWALFHDEGAAFWDDPGTAALETRDQVIEQALVDAERELTAGFGDDVGSWSVGSSRVDLQACKLEYSIVSPK